MEKICSKCKGKFDAEKDWQSVCKPCYRAAKEQERLAKEGQAPISESGSATAWRIARSTALAQSVLSLDPKSRSVDKILELAKIYANFIYTGASPVFLTVEEEEVIGDE